MKSKDIRPPKSNAVQELRERYNKRKEDRLKKYDDLAEALKKKFPLKKIANNLEFPDVEL